MADVLIGVAGPLSGQYQNFGQQMLNGAKTAADAINAQGGVGGEQLAVISADDACDSRQAEVAAQKLVDAHVDVVIGHFCSHASLAAARLYDKANLTMISPSATLPDLTEAKIGAVIRLATRIDRQGAFAASYILRNHPQAEVAILDDSTASNRAFVRSFLSAYARAPVLAQSFAPDAKDFGKLLSDIKAKGAKTIYCACAASDAGRFLSQARLQGLKVDLFGPDALLGEQFWESAGGAGEGTMVSFPSDPLADQRSKPVVAALRAGGISPEGATLPAYAAVELYAAAAKASGAHSGKAIATWLRSGSPILTAIGGFRFDSRGDSADLRFTWFIWNNGKYQAIRE